MHQLTNLDTIKKTTLDSSSPNVFKLSSVLYFLKEKGEKCRAQIIVVIETKQFNDEERLRYFE